MALRAVTIAHTVHVDDLELLRLQLDTRFEHAGGRILRENAPDHAAAPRLCLGGCFAGNILRLRHDVAEPTAKRIEALAKNEPPLANEDSTPVNLDAYVELLTEDEPVKRCEAGLAWVFPDRRKYQQRAWLIRSGTHEGDRLIARLRDRGMPEELVRLGFKDTGELWEPWCIALEGEEIASIAFSARLGKRAAEVGVITVPEYRGHGLASAATAGWASHPALHGLPLFYGANRTNTSSRQVAARLGLRFLGANLSIT